MKSQQAAEREEQQRIKNLVLNYDLRDGEEQDGDSQLNLTHDLNIHTVNLGIEKAAAAASHARPDKSSNNRSGQRARKLQLSDVDWYEKNHMSRLENIPLSEKQKSPRTPYLPANGSDPVVTDRHRPLPNREPARVTGQGRLTRRQIFQEHASRQAGKADPK